MSFHICIYCASSTKIDPDFEHAAVQVGELIAARGWNLVYGGGGIGLMGAVSRTVMDLAADLENASKPASTSKVIGIIPKQLMELEIGNTDCDELIITENMRDRKAKMEQRADAFIILPGGFGTMEELFEILTHRCLGYHDKPIVILNDKGFYDPLIEMMAHMYEHKFAREKWKDQYEIVNHVPDVFSTLDHHLL